MAFSGLVYRKRGRDASASFYVAPTGLDCSLLLLPRAMPWASIFRPFGAERNPLYSNPENGLGCCMVRIHCHPERREGSALLRSVRPLYGNPVNGQEENRRLPPPPSAREKPRRRGGRGWSFCRRRESLQGP